MAVPNTTTFTLVNVCDELSLTGSNRNLVQCFASAISGNFDPAYSGAKNNLLNFRNYGASGTISLSQSSINLGFSNTPVLVGVTASAAWTTVITGSSGFFTISATSGSSGFSSISFTYIGASNTGKTGSVQFQIGGVTKATLSITEIS